MAKLPVGAVASQSLDFAWSNFGTLLKIGWFPLLASAVFSSAAELPILAGDEVDLSTAPNMAMVLIGGIGATFLWAIFAVAVHRMILLDGAVPDDWLYFRLSGQEIRYAIAPFVLALIPLLIVFGTTAVLFGANMLSGLMSAQDIALPNSGRASVIQGLGMLVAVLLAIFVMIRLVLVMPIVVAEGKIGIRRAWTVSSGNFWRLVSVHLLVGIAMTLFLFAFGVVVALWLFVASAAGLSAPLTGGGTLGLFLAMIGGIFSYLVLAFFGTVAFLAVLSFSYKALTITYVTEADAPSVSES